MLHRLKYAALAAGCVTAFGALAQEPAPTASGLSSEGKQDLSAGTSQTGSPNQPALNVLTSLQGADVEGTEGETIGELTDVLVDENGAVRQIVIETGGLLSSRRLVDSPQIPSSAEGKLTLPLAKSDLESLPEFEGSPSAPPWSATSLVGAEFAGVEGASIADMRFNSANIDRVIIDTGRDDPDVKIVEVPFADLKLSGSATEPIVTLSDEGKRRLDAR